MDTQTPVTKLFSLAQGSKEAITPVVEVLAGLHLNYADLKTKLNDVDKYLNSQFNNTTTCFGYVNNQLGVLNCKVDKCQCLEKLHKEEMGKTREICLVKNNIMILGRNMNNVVEEVFSMKDTLEDINSLICRIHDLHLRNMSNGLATTDKIHAMEMFMMKLNSNVGIVNNNLRLFCPCYCTTDIPVMPARSLFNSDNYPPGFQQVEEINLDLIYIQLAIAPTGTMDSHNSGQSRGAGRSTYSGHTVQAEASTLMPGYMCQLPATSASALEVGETCEGVEWVITCQHRPGGRSGKMMLASH